MVEIGTNRRAVALSNALLKAGLQLSAELDYAQLNDRALARAAGVSVADFRSIFGDLEAYLHVLQLHLSTEQGSALRSALTGGGGRQQRLQRAGEAFLDLCLQRRGARNWIAALSRRSAPLQASRRRHARQHARILEPEFRDKSGPAAVANSRLLVAALRAAARSEAQRGVANGELRRALAGLIGNAAAG